MSGENLENAAMGMAAIHNEFDRMFPPVTPGRGKRRHQDWDERGLFLEAVHSFHLGKPTEWTIGSIEAAFKNGDTTVFRVIEEARRHFSQSTPTKFSESVIAARTARVVLWHRLGCIPTKGEVIEEVIERLGYRTYGSGEVTRWTEILREAGLSRLPKKKAMRGQTRHGEK